MLDWLITNLLAVSLRSVASNMRVSLKLIYKLMGAGERMFYILHSAMIEGGKPLLELNKK